MKPPNPKSNLAQKELLNRPRSTERGRFLLTKKRPPKYKIKVNLWITGTQRHPPPVHKERHLSSNPIEKHFHQQCNIASFYILYNTILGTIILTFKDSLSTL